jgi:hypothetical protein
MLVAVKTVLTVQLISAVTVEFVSTGGCTPLPGCGPVGTCDPTAAAAVGLDGGWGCDCCCVSCG